MVTIEQAQETLVNDIININDHEIGDRLYELASEMVEKAIEKTENKNSIDTTDLETYEMWYDDVRDECREILFDKFATFLNQ